MKQYILLDGPGHCRVVSENDGSISLLLLEAKLLDKEVPYLGQFCDGYDGWCLGKWINYNGEIGVGFVSTNSIISLPDGRYTISPGLESVLKNIIKL